MVCDVEMLSSKFFHERRVNSGLDSRDSHRIGLGLSPVGSCRLPLKEQGRLTRLEIDASNLGFGLILGDFREWLMVGNANYLGLFCASVIRPAVWRIG